MIKLVINFSVSAPDITRYLNVPGLLCQPKIANILSWQYLANIFELLWRFGALWKKIIQPALPSKHEHESVSNKVLPKITDDLCITFGTYIEALGTMGI